MEAVIFLIGWYLMGLAVAKVISKFKKSRK